MLGCLNNEILKQPIMSQLQKIKFENMEEFLTFLPENEIKIVQTLRKIVLGCFPNPIEKLSYNVPYYYQHSRVCFI